MLQVKTLGVPVRLEDADMRAVLASLEEAGWIPAMRHSETEFLGLAGLKKDMDIRTLSRAMTSRRYGPRFYEGGGDLFFRDEDILYLLALPGKPVVSHRLDRPTFRLRGEQPYLEVGIISLNATGLDDRLKKFTQTIELSINSCVDGRKTRHMTFDWEETKPSRVRRDGLIKAREEEGARSFRLRRSIMTKWRPPPRWRVSLIENCFRD